jgi:hypothetical protein
MLTRGRFVALLALLLGLLALGIQAAQARHGTGGAQPSGGKQPSPSIFGIDTGTFDSVRGHFGRDFGASRALGARWDRFTLTAATGSGNFSVIDAEVKSARKHHMGVVLSFAGIPQACSVGSLKSNAQRCPPTTSADLHRYQAYVRKVLVRYRKAVLYYESWTEINHNTSAMNAAQYAAVLKAQYSVVQSVNHRYHTHLKLLYGSEVGFGIKPGSSWTAVIPFTAEVLGDLHGSKPFDGIALHAYRFPPVAPSTATCDYVGNVSVSAGGTTPSCHDAGYRALTWPQELTAYEQEFQNNGYGQVPLWVTEFGWPAGGNCSSLPAGYCLATSTQATDVNEAYRDLLGLPFVQGALWFNLRDYQPGFKSPDPPFFYHYGLLNYNYSPKSAGSGFKALARANPGR